MRSSAQSSPDSSHSAELEKWFLSWRLGSPKVFELVAR